MSLPPAVLSHIKFPKTNVGIFFAKRIKAPFSLLASRYVESVCKKECFPMSKLIPPFGFALRACLLLFYHISTLVNMTQKTTPKDVMKKVSQTQTKEHFPVKKLLSPFWLYVMSLPLLFYHISTLVIPQAKILPSTLIQSLSLYTTKMISLP